jgi:hypothetical protein
LLGLRLLVILYFARQGAKTQSALQIKQTKSHKLSKSANEIRDHSPDERENPFVAAFDTKDWNDSGK